MLRIYRNPYSLFKVQSYYLTIAFKWLKCVRTYFKDGLKLDFNQGLKPVKNRKFENRKSITAFSFGMLEAVIGYR
jgi:hypothetical protein